MQSEHNKPSLKVAIVIVNYCSSDYTVKAVRSILKESLENNQLDNWSVVIVDNCSPDDSVETLNAAINASGWDKQGVTLIPHPVNGGFGAGCNVGVNHCLAQQPLPDAFYFMNPDAESTGNALQPLLTTMLDHPKCAIVGGAVLLENDETWTPGFRFPGALSELESNARWGLVSKILNRHKVHRTIHHTEEVDWVGGYSFLVRTEAIVDVGTMDERFFLYFEETDWCHRMKQAGWSVIAEPRSLVVHAGGASTEVGHAGKRLPDYWFHSRAWYFYQRGGMVKLILANLGWLIGQLLWRAKCLLKPDLRQQDPPHLLKDFLQHSFGLNPSTRTRPTNESAK